jgi:ribosomal protein S8E
MSVWHGSMRKRKLTGGKKRAYRVKKKYEEGGFPAETVMG